MENKDFDDLRILERMERLREAGPRDSNSAAAARAAFLRQAAHFAQGVSPGRFQRLNQWAAIPFFLAAFIPRNRKGVPMFAAVMTIVLLASLAFGGSAIAAQSSAPDDTLYPLKLWTEDARLSIASDEEAQFQLSLEFSERRMAEIQTMLQNGETPPESTMTNLQNQWNRALQLAADVPEEGALLLQLQTQLRQQEQTLTQLRLRQDAPGDLTQVRGRVQTMLQQQIQLCQDGMENPEALQEQLRMREQERLQQQTQDGTPIPQGDQTQTQNQEQIQNQFSRPAGTETPAPTGASGNNGNGNQGSGNGNGGKP